MTLQPPYGPDTIDTLVHDYLDAQSRQVDLEQNLASIFRKVREAPPEIVESRDPFAVDRALGHRIRPIWRMAAAASIVVACGLFWYLAAQPEPASAFALVSGAETELTRPRDRCYRVESVMPKAWRKNNPWLATNEQTVVWTRGQQFRVVSRHDGRDVVWGQDHDRRLWIAVEGQPGLRYDRDEVPPMFARTRAYLGLDVRKLADRFLKQFDLEVVDRRRDGRIWLATIRATARKGEEQYPFNAATIEIEAKSKVIRRLELVREVNGTERARFTFDLVDEAPQPEAKYELEGNVASENEILGRDKRETRDEVLRELLPRSAGLENGASTHH
jgi:hypothetical protein